MIFEAKHSAKWRAPDGYVISVSPENYHTVMAAVAKNCKHPIVQMTSILGCVFNFDAPWVWYIEQVLKTNYTLDAFYDEAFCKSFAEWIIAVINNCESMLIESTGKPLNLGGIK